jgi:AcrR family transcriptional regulator
VDGVEELPLKKKVSSRAASSKRAQAVAEKSASQGDVAAQSTASVSQPARRSPGRARSDASRVAILRAVLRLLESQSLQQISIEAIAREAGVGKATIYRWWPSKASVVIDAFIQYHVAHTLFARDLPVREALDRHLHRLIEEYSGRSGAWVAQILAEGQGDPAVLEELRARFFAGRQQLVHELLQAGRRSGEIRTDLDPVLVMDMIYAPIYLRLLVGHLPLDRHFAQQHVAMVLQLFGLESPKRRRSKPGP